MQSYIVKEATLRHIADAVREQTNAAEPLLLENLPAQIKTLTDTSDANAQEVDLFAGRTAYVDGQKITGKKVDVKINSSRTGSLWYYNGSKFIENSFSAGYSTTIQIQKGSNFIVLGTASRPSSLPSGYKMTYPTLSVSNGSRYVEYRSFYLNGSTTMLFFYFVHVNGASTVSLSSSESLITE